MSRRTRRVRAGWMLLGLAFPLLAASANAQTSGESPKSLDELFVLFGVDKVPADFVVVVDTSGSMSSGGNPPYPRVLEAFGALVDSIPEGDTLSVVTFSGSPELSFQGKVTSESRASAKAALPPVATGRNTDIGGALDETLRRLERADSSDVQLVIFLTDGQHQPGAGSAFPGTSGASWDSLRSRADAVGASHELLVQGVGLGNQGAGGIELLRTVFGNPQINSLPPDQLPDYFRESVRRTQVARLKTLVDAELANGVHVVSSGTATLDNPMEIDVEVQSQLKKLPVDLTVSGVTVTDSDGRAVKAEVVSDEHVRVGPGATTAVRIRLKPPVDDPGFKVPPVTEHAEYEIKLDATYQVLPKDLLARVTPTPTTGTVEGTHGVDASRTYGWTVRKLLAMVVGVLLALWILAWLYKRFLQLPKLVGFFVLDKAANEEKAVIPLKGKRQRLTAKDVPGAAAAKIELFTRRGKPRHVYARVDQPQFYEVQDRRHETLVTEETEIRYGQYRLGGGRMKYQPKPPVRD